MEGKLRQAGINVKRKMRANSKYGIYRRMFKSNQGSLRKGFLNLGVLYPDLGEMGGLKRNVERLRAIVRGKPEGEG